MATNTITENIVFGYASGSDSPAYSKNLMTNVVSTYLGSVNYTGTTGSWPISNAHGDTVGVTDVNATFVANAPTDEYGRGTAPADRLGWLGAHYRFNIGGTQNLTRMGVRLYDPNLGRFLQVDPVEGGNANDYIYPADPVNLYDLDGNVSSACAVTLYKRRAGAKTAKTGQRIACGDGTTYVVPPPTFSSLWDDFGYAWNAFVKAAKALQPDTKALFRTALLLLKTALTVLDKQPFKPPLPPYVPHPCKASAMWCPPPQA